MLVKDLLKDKSREVITTKPTATVAEAMELLLKHNIGCLPVFDEADDLIGIVSDKDIFRAAHQFESTFKKLPISQLMSTEVLIGIPEDEVEYVAGIMTYNRVRHIPIMDGGRMVNLLSIGDIVKARISDMKSENRYLKMYIEGSYPG